MNISGNLPTYEQQESILDGINELKNTAGVSDGNVSYRPVTEDSLVIEEGDLIDHEGYAIKSIKKIISANKNVLIMKAVSMKDNNIAYYFIKKNNYEVVGKINNSTPGFNGAVTSVADSTYWNRTGSTMVASMNAQMFLSEEYGRVFYFTDTNSSSSYGSIFVFDFKNNRVHNISKSIHSSNTAQCITVGRYTYALIHGTDTSNSTKARTYRLDNEGAVNFDLLYEDASDLYLDPNAATTFANSSSIYSIRTGNDTTGVFYIIDVTNKISYKIDITKPRATRQLGKASGQLATTLYSYDYGNMTKIDQGIYDSDSAVYNLNDLSSYVKNIHTFDFTYDRITSGWQMIGDWYYNYAGNTTWTSGEYTTRDVLCHNKTTKENKVIRNPYKNFTYCVPVSSNGENKFILYSGAEDNPNELGNTHRIVMAKVVKKIAYYEPTTIV